MRLHAQRALEPAALGDQCLPRGGGVGEARLRVLVTLLLIEVAARQRLLEVDSLLRFFVLAERAVELGGGAARLEQRFGLVAQAREHFTHAARAARIEQALAQLTLTLEERLGALAQRSVIEPEHREVKLAAHASERTLQLHFVDWAL